MTPRKGESREAYLARRRDHRLPKKDGHKTFDQPPSMFQLEQKRWADPTDELEKNWFKRTEKSERENELRDLEFVRNYFYGAIEPREVVEVAELRKRFIACYGPSWTSAHFRDFFVTAVADNMLLIKNKVRTANSRRERVTFVAVNSQAGAIFQQKKLEYAELNKPALPDKGKA
jgi:hypothetical protein